MKYAYVATLVFSIFLYAIPFEFGGNIMRVSMAFTSIAFLLYVIRKIWLLVEKEDRNKVVLLLVNALAVLHFILIFIIVVMDPSYFTIFLVGSIIASLVFYVVHDRMKRN